jgi:hypothetical protein
VGVAEKEKEMDELLTHVLEAHGGLDNWSKVATLTAEVSLDGPFWDWRKQHGIRQPQTMKLDTRREHITLTPFAGHNLTMEFQGHPEHIAIRSADGAVIEEKDYPKASFPPYNDHIEWNSLQLAYFTGTANWNYLVEPFLFANPDVQVREIEPWKEGSEVWRRLAVTFPPDLPNHNPDQVFYYDENFMLRRMDYSPDITGNSQIAHYTHDPRVFDGFVFYTRRLVHVRDENGIANQDFAAITIATHSISVERR